MSDQIFQSFSKRLGTRNHHKSAIEHRVSNR
jgi:hypothetical protein